MHRHNNKAGPIPISQPHTSAAPTFSMRQPLHATAAVPKLTISPPHTDNAGNSDSTANANTNASMSTNNASSNADHDTATTQQKRKRSDSDPADAVADATTPKRTSPTATVHVSAAGSARATMDGLAGAIRLAPNGAVN